MIHPRLYGFLFGAFIALSVFGLAEAIQAAGANPFITGEPL